MLNNIEELKDYCATYVSIKGTGNLYKERLQTLNNLELNEEEKEYFKRFSEVIKEKYLDKYGEAFSADLYLVLSYLISLKEDVKKISPGNMIMVCDYLTGINNEYLKEEYAILANDELLTTVKEKGNDLHDQYYILMDISDKALESDVYEENNVDSFQVNINNYYKKLTGIDIIKRSDNYEDYIAPKEINKKIL